MDVAIYLRISDDRNEDEGGVRRQGVDTVGHALVRGASQIVFYVENDTSAFKKKRITMADPEGFRYYVWRVIRPRWQKMLSALRTGAQQGVVVANIDRLARDNRDLEDAIELATYYRRRFEGVTGSLDLNTDDGMAMARVMVAMANKQSADTARRTRRKHQELAEAGIPVGAHRPFGWQEDKRTIDHAEAEEIRQAVAKILAGVTPTGIMHDWHERGVLTPRGNTWKWSPFLSMLRNPRLCGLRARMVRSAGATGRVSDHWEVVKKPDGTEVVGQWEPIITRDKWDALIARIGESAKPALDYTVGGNRKYLLSGLVRCGKCQHHPRMTGVSSLIRGTRYFRYQCYGKLDGGCGSNTRSMPKVDELIRDIVFKRHDELSEAGGPVDEPDDGDKERLEDIEELLQELWTQWKHPERSQRLPSKDYFAMRAELVKERDELLAARSVVENRTASADQARDVRKGWDTATVHEKRAFIERYLEAVLILPIEPVWNQKLGRVVRPGSREFDEDLIEPVWR
ncbi:Site-specific DNA recombinase [Micromonospora rhizosphaerae]|uniref:Site-specific DNA recombinase n=2 Tax=Micromonospora rhizosphaerae TaxID=568872 RepID=A0A1C6SF18_9ACTN|nr:Site-specific DNA recombinase [Micromonospora rhizosphaerae]